MTTSVHEALTCACSHAIDHLQGLDDRPVAARTSVAELRARLGRRWSDHGMPPRQVVDDLVAATDGGHLGSASGRFYAWVIGGALPSALAADRLAAASDQNAASAACGPAAAVVEEVAGAWLQDVLGLPREASFAFTSGCQMAHFTCLAAARHAVLAAHGWDVHRDGLSGAPPIRVVTSDQRHGSIDRAVRYLGLGSRHLVTLPADADGRMEPGALGAALDGARRPTIVVLKAGDLNIAAIDPMRALIPLAHAAGAWVHVDGAFGLIALASRAKRHLLDGVADADSWATDAHKWLNVPFDSGLAFVRDAEAHRASMTIAASYITDGAGVRDAKDWGPEWSRRARGFAVYAALRELGRNGLEDLVDRCCVHAQALVTRIGAIPGAECVRVSALNQGLVRFPDPRPGASPEEHDAHTDAVIASINATGEAFFSGTTWRGRRAMRVSVVNWRTSAQDVERTVACVRQVLGEGRARLARG